MGQLVKLAFEFEPRTVDGAVRNGERMWVQVLETRDDGSFLGRLENEPAVLVELSYGDLVEFCPEHVIAIADDS